MLLLRLACGAFFSSRAVKERRQSWLENAAALPVAFAQVREDALLDQAVVRGLGAEASRLIMVASGGCTAALLASMPQVRSLRLVDANPAQLALTKLKLRLLLDPSTEKRLRLLGHLGMPADARRQKLKTLFSEIGLEENVFGPISLVARLGPDHVGRYERVFAALRRALASSQTELDSLLSLSNVGEQIRAAATESMLGRRLDEALEKVMSMPNLVRLFGAEATNNPLVPFSRHFARQIRRALAEGTACDNPYLWQMLKGRYPAGCFAPWFACAAPPTFPEIAFVNTSMEQALESAKEPYDFIHLSNILDWLSPKAAARTLQLTEQALKPGGRIFIRQLNSALDIRRAGVMFEWLNEESEALHKKDRSFFYRALHLGRKK